ncbi:amino acid ABC transporter permease [Candidatus Babeliales bacterium]|nr:amino acid ABC transporter permease [Candidatus Babeliales bacterium]
MFNASLFIKILPQLIVACGTTVKIAFFSTCIGLCGGTIIAFAYRSNFFMTRYLAKAYVALVRGTPMIVQIVFFYYGLKLPFSPLVIAILAIGFNSSAYISQVILSGIAAVDKGEIEAAYVLGFTKFQTMRFIILPQAFKIVLPALASELVTLIKDSSLAYIIGVNELFKQSRAIMSSTYDIITLYIAVSLLYFIMTFTVSCAIDLLEKKWNKLC